MCQCQLPLLRADSIHSWFMLVAVVWSSLDIPLLHIGSWVKIQCVCVCVCGWVGVWVWVCVGGWVWLGGGGVFPSDSSHYVCVCMCVVDHCAFVFPPCGAQRLPS